MVGRSKRRPDKMFFSKPIKQKKEAETMKVKIVKKGTRLQETKTNYCLWAFM